MLLQEEAVDPRIFENGIYLIGQSQGGIIVRGIYQYCLPLQSKIKKMFLQGSPNLGISYLPYTSTNYIISHFSNKLGQDNEIYQIVDRINRKVQDFFLNPFVYDKVKNISVFQLIASPKNGNELFISDLLKDLNFSNFSYKNLETLVTFSYQDEYVVNPKISTSFGAYYDKSMTPFNNYAFYQQGFLDLNRMYDAGNFILCVVKGEHISESDYDQDFMFRMLEDTRCDEQTLKRLYWQYPVEPPSSFYY